MTPPDADPFRPSRPPSRRPALHASTVASVFVGGCAGGLLRFVATRHWLSGSLFPWSTFAVNVGGAFVLALLLVLVADVLGPSAYLRPLVGTGFCGGLTTFSSVVVSVDRLAAHGHLALAAGYLAASIAGGLAAGFLGLVIGRTFAAYRRDAGRRREA